MLSKTHINNLEYTQSYAEMQFNARRKEHHCTTQHIIFDSHSKLMQGHGRKKVIAKELDLAEIVHISFSFKTHTFAYVFLEKIQTYTTLR